MSKAIAIFRTELARTEAARMAIVLGCSAALILAAKPLPF